MPYALIPEGYSLKKVTTAQEAAVHSKRRHDDVLALLGNENTPLLIGAAGLALLLPAFIEWFLQAQEDALNITLTDKQKTSLVDYVNISLGPIGLAQVLGRKTGLGVAKALADFEFPKDFKLGGLA